MCCILGMAFQNGNNINNSDQMIEIATRLLSVGQSRGTTATGVAFVTPKEVSVLKHNVPAKNFVLEEIYKKLIKEKVCFDASQKENYHYEPLMTILGHCRQKTQGSELNYDNNHPITAGNIIGIHNGIVSNDYELFMRFEKLGMKRKAEVDSEIIFRLIDYYLDEDYGMADAICFANNIIQGSFACAAVNYKDPYSIWIFKGHSPVTIIHYEDEGFIIFSSEKRMIEYAVKHVTLSKPKEIELGAFEGVGIDVHQNTIMKFNLDYHSLKRKNTKATNFNCA
jgi:glucosamine 6-phosphate synthetase-like amidotransferase/phosphosugar isomerase protein